MSEVNKSAIQLIPIEKIKILNPRVRNKKKFQEIISNISNLGLKKPITVSLGKGKDGDVIRSVPC